MWLLQISKVQNSLASFDLQKVAKFLLYSCITFYLRYIIINSIVNWNVNGCQGPTLFWYLSSSDAMSQLSLLFIYLQLHLNQILSTLFQRLMWQNCNCAFLLLITACVASSLFLSAVWLFGVHLCYNIGSRFKIVIFLHKASNIFCNKMWDICSQ